MGQLRRDLQKSNEILARYKELLPDMQEKEGENLCPNSFKGTNQAKIDCNKPEGNPTIIPGIKSNPTFTADRCAESWEILEGHQQQGLQPTRIISGSKDSMVSASRRSVFPVSIGSHRSVSPSISRSHRSVSPPTIGSHCHQRMSKHQFMMVSPVITTPWQSERICSAALPRTKGVASQWQYKQPKVLVHVRNPEIYQTRVF